MQTAHGRSFLKMHGLGNDFVIVDARREPFAVNAEKARRIADRHRGVGFDQLIVLEPPRVEGTVARVRFWNADGGESGACGNGSRCVAWLLARETGRQQLVFETAAGQLACRQEDDGRVTVNLGPAHSDWREIPLARAQDTLHLQLSLGPLADPAALSVGNPHATFFVADAQAIDLVALGPQLEQNPLFPERANIAVAQLIGADALRARVWERGVGLTEACGTGAAAAAVNACRRGLTGRRVTVTLDGGALEILWREDGEVEMTGSVALSFEGRLAEELAP